MSYRTLLFTVLVVVTLASCKIQIEVPTGGSVASQSGNYTCAEGKTCVIDVVDLFFDETFVARPKAGYEFVRWKKKAGGFCGAGKARFKPCHLYTSVFEGIPVLEQFLARDDVFYLQPVFALEDSGGSGGGGGGGDGGDGENDPSAAACYNPKIFNKGYRTMLEYRIESGPDTIVSTQNSLTNGPGLSSGGRSGTKISSDIKAKTDGQTITARTQYFVEVNNARKRSTSFAIETQLLSPQTGSITTIHNPGILSRFDLNKGQAFSQSYNTEITTKFPGFNNTESTQTDLGTTYLGQVSVTVPAGTFKACKFNEQSTTTVAHLPPISNTTTLWFAVGTGVLIKSVGDEDSSQLLSGTINGKAM